MGSLIIEPSQKMMEAASNLENDIESNRLVREYIDISERLYKPGEIEKLTTEDPTSRILIDANIKYHEKKMSEVLNSLSKDMKSSKLSPAIMNKRKVRESHEGARQVDCDHLQHLHKSKSESKRDRRPKRRVILEA